jgi:hypothetical protein
MTARACEYLHQAGNDLASTRPARPKQKRNRKAPTKKDQDWKEVTDMLAELYPKEKLKVVMVKIKEKYGFEAT